MLDHENKIIERIRNRPPKKDIHDPKLNMLVTKHVQQVKTDMSNLKITPQLGNLMRFAQRACVRACVHVLSVAGWFGHEKTEEVGGFHTKLYNVQDFVIYLSKRGPKDNSTDPLEPLEVAHFQGDYCERDGPAEPLLYKDEEVSTKRKTFSATAWLSSSVAHACEYADCVR